jgi:hypothetical protein
MGGRGSITVTIEGERYAGLWVFSPNAQFSPLDPSARAAGAQAAPSMAPTVIVNIDNTAPRNQTGFAAGMAQGAAAFQSSAAQQPRGPRGMITLRADSGRFVRCLFDFDPLGGNGLGECRRNDGRMYDLMLSR